MRHRRRSGAEARRQSPWLVIAMAALVMGSLALAIANGADFEGYTQYFTDVRANGWEAVADSRFEPFFGALVIALAGTLSSDAALFGTLAFASLALKLRAIALLGVERRILLLVGAVYIVRYLPLHEMTQLRVAVALAFVMTALLPNQRLWWLLLPAAAVTHYSTAMLLPLALLWRFALAKPAAYRRVEPYVWASLLLVVLAAALTVGALLEPLSRELAVIDLYSSIGFGDEQVNLFSLAVVVDVFFLLVALPLLRREAPTTRFWVFTQGLALLLFFGFHDFPVLAHRFRELLSVFWVPYLCLALRAGWRERLHARAFCAVNLIVYAYLNMFSSHALIHWS